MSAVELRAFEKNAEKKKVNNMISAVRKNEPGKNAFSKHIRRQGDSNGICLVIAQKDLSGYTFEKKSVQISRRTFKSKKKSEL